VEQANICKQALLIVDDEPINIAILYQYLSRLGFRILVAQNGAAAICEAKRTQPDAILLDVVMPHLDGFETCRQLKRQAETAHIPVVFMTGLRDAHDKVQGLQVGAVDYVTKPLELQEVLNCITPHLK